MMMMILILILLLEKTKTFEGNPLPVGGDNAGLLENVGGGASDLVPVPGQVLEYHRHDYCYYNAADEGNVVDDDDDDNCHLVVGSQKYI